MDQSNIHVLTGINAILNKDNIKPGLNIKQIEKDMLSEGIISKPSDTNINFDDELKSDISKLGIDFEEYEEPEYNFADVKIDKPTKQEEPNTLEFYTKEQKKREHIANVMRPERDDPIISFEEEKKEDLKCEMLAEIDALIEDLEVEGMDLSRIPKVDKNSSFTEVENALKVLRHKNDHSQYCNFANELILLFAHALGKLFDGKTIWFGKYRPDLTGWHNIVLQKTRRMRYDTGQIVYKLMQDYKISPVFRILLELIPNMLIYSNTKSSGFGKDLFNDEMMNNVAKKTLT